MAGSSAGGEEFLSITEAVEPNIIFLVDMSKNMADPCDGTSGDPCIEVVADAIDQVTQHFDWARFAVVGTSDDSAYGDTFYPVVPLGTDYASLSEALDGLEAHSTKTLNLAEALVGIADDYLGNTTTDDGIDDDGDGFDNDWDEAGIEYWCQETHVIIIAQSHPWEDSGVDSSYVDSALTTDVLCDDGGLIWTGTDSECLLDNVVSYLYDNDIRADLSDDQLITTHIVGIDIASTALAEYLFGNVSDEIDGAGLYATADDAEGIVAAVLMMIQDIRSGTYSRSTPVVSAEGDYLVYTFYELSGDDEVGLGDGLALAQGHIRAYEIDDDPTSSTYGQVMYDGPSEYGGALWDGGTLLVSRPVTAGESNPDDRDGFGKRDIYTFYEPAMDISAMNAEGDGDRRMGFDYEFVDAVGSSSSVLDTILDTEVSSTDAPCAEDDSYDLTKDDCLVDEDDLQALVDFARGLPEAEFRYLEGERGRWKLGDSPHSIPVIVEGRNSMYAVDPTYREFLAELEANSDAGTSPDIVLLAANDGMLHAFQLEDDTTTSDTEEGEELWAWLPGYLLERDHDAEWAGRLVDLMLYGRTFLFDGAPVVEDVWIDADDDGVKDCDSVPDDCEWHRVVVVQQGQGGPVTLALDITDTNDPEFLWEQTDEGDATAMGYTVGRPTVANIYDASDSDNPADRWVAFWGSGRAVPYSEDAAYYKTAEANLYMWHVGDDYWETDEVHYQDEDDEGFPIGDNWHPEATDYGSTLDGDGDDSGHYEYGYISAALAVVDVDSDGDADTLYFPVTASYSPVDEGGGGYTDPSDPGSTWMYKACLSTTEPDDLTWVEFYDPVDDGALDQRAEVYYAATTAWLTDGALGVYWGTGTPYDRESSDEGYFFAMKDTAPNSCDDDYMAAITDCGADGVYTLDAGEGLTSDPVVYAGTVYFATWVPETDRCDGGTGRLYGLDFEDCDPGMDTDGDGDIDEEDEPYLEEEDSYISGVTVTDKGTLFYGSSDVLTDGSGDAVGTIDVENDPFLGTQTMAWMEVF
jgi:hypothetical protein